jgi:hypothetical protein
MNKSLATLLVLLVFAFLTGGRGHTASAQAPDDTSHEQVQQQRAPTACPPDIQWGCVLSGSASPGLTLNSTSTASSRYSLYATMNNPGSGSAAIWARMMGSSAKGSAVYGSHMGSSYGVSGVLGVLGNTSAGQDSAGVRGINKGTGGYGYGVWGSHSGAGPGVKGSSANGFGGEFVSDNYRGAYVRGGPSWIALYADGWAYVNGNLDVTANTWITGDLSVSGTCTGCTDTYAARNSGSESIAPGDLVATAGVEVDPQSGQPVLLVRRAGQPGDAVIGVAGRALVRDTVGERASLSNQPLVPTEGTATPNAYVQVIVSGLAQVRATAPDIQIGDLLAPSTDGGAVRAMAPGAFARAVSAPDAQGLVWALVSVTH